MEARLTQKVEPIITALLLTVRTSEVIRGRRPDLEREKEKANGEQQQWRWPNHP